MDRKRQCQEHLLPEVMCNYFSVKEGSLSPNTKKNYRYALQTLQRHLYRLGIELMEITEEDMLEVQDAMITEGKKPETVGRFLRRLMPFFKWFMTRKGVDSEEISRIIVLCENSVRAVKGEQAHPALTLAQQETLFQAIKNPYLRIIVWAGVSYGFRSQELCNLKVGDVIINESGVNDRGEPDWGHLVIRQSKRNKTRKVYILQEHLPTWKMIFRLREVNKIGFPQVFYWNMKPLKGSNVSSLFKAHISSLVDFDVTSHCLRRTFATNLYRRGVGIIIIQNLLGHDKIETTRIYLNIMEEETRINYIETIQKNRGGIRE